jgi:hypothetical protein
MAGYMEYLDGMVDKTSELEASIVKLNATYGKAKAKMAEPGKHSADEWLDAQEIINLFEDAGKQKKDIAAQIVKLKLRMADAKKTFAVDAPDGETDGHMQEEMEEVNRIIDDDAKIHIHEKK